MATNETPRTNLGRLVDVVAGVRQQAARLDPAEERALWAAVRAMAEDKLAAIERKGARHGIS